VSLPISPANAESLVVTVCGGGHKGGDEGGVWCVGGWMMVVGWAHAPGSSGASVESGGCVETEIHTHPTREQQARQEIDRICRRPLPQRGHILSTKVEQVVAAVALR
jgi:hypothetical protein